MVIVEKDMGRKKGLEISHPPPPLDQPALLFSRRLFLRGQRYDVVGCSKGFVGRYRMCLLNSVP